MIKSLSRFEPYALSLLPLPFFLAHFKHFQFLFTIQALTPCILQDCYFVYGQTFSGRYLLVLIRLLSVAEASELGLPHGSNAIKIITAREMNPKQRRLYLKRKGI